MFNVLTSLSKFSYYRPKFHLNVKTKVIKMKTNASKLQASSSQLQKKNRVSIRITNQLAKEEEEVRDLGV